MSLIVFAILRLRAILTLALILTIGALCWSATPVHASSKAPFSPRVTLWLKWFHQYQFAGYYMAKELGYYAEAGLDVDIREYEMGVDVVGRVLLASGNYGVSGSELLLDRLSGKPVVVLGVVFQHSPSVVLAKESSGVKSPHDLAGRRVMLDLAGEPDIRAMLLNEGVPIDSLLLPEHINWDIELLLRDEIDATAAYATNTPYRLEREGIPYVLINPRTYGVDFYGDNFFTSEAEIKKHPKRAMAFRQASLRGWVYAMSHPDETIRIIQERYPTRKSEEHLRFEYRHMRELILPDLVTMGHMNDGRWEHIAKTYARLGMVRDGYSLDGFLFDPTAPSESPLLRSLLVGFVAALLAALVLTAWLTLFNKRLQAAVKKRTRELSEMNAELVREIQDREETEERLRGREETIRAMSNASHDALIMIDSRGIISYWNPAAERMFGHDADEAMGADIHALLASAEDMEKARKGLVAYARTGTGPIVGGMRELMAKRKSGELFPVELAVASFKNQGEWCAVGSVRDITERREAEERLRSMAVTDGLTGLANRRHFMEQATKEFERSKRHGRVMCMVIFDVDHFKQVNDNYGHDIGDEVLKALARTGTAMTRSSDLLGRLGGEEFGLLLTETDIDGAREFCERLRRAVAEMETPTDKGPLRVTVSLGAAMIRPQCVSVDDILKRADKALYKAKNAGRNRVETAWP